jgi:hypothetical protein
MVLIAHHDPSYYGSEASQEDAAAARDWFGTLAGLLGMTLIGTEFGGTTDAYDLYGEGGDWEDVSDEAFIAWSNGMPVQAAAEFLKREHRALEN